MDVLIDTNVVLDHLLAREPFAADARRVWQACAHGQFQAYISPITPVNVFYIARKLRSADLARDAVVQLLALFKVCPMGGDTLRIAISLPLKDFEDAVQCACAKAVGVNVIITRDPKDYAGSGLTVLSPADFLVHLAA